MKNLEEIVKDIRENIVTAEIELTKAKNNDIEKYNFWLGYQTANTSIILSLEFHNLITKL